MTTETPRALAGVRVLDCTELMGQYAGKLLADLGADVIRVEPPGGSTARRTPPFYHDDPDEDRCLEFWYFNTNKRGLTLNLRTEDGQEIFRRLLANTDILIESFLPSERDLLLPSDREIEEINPALVRCSVTGFGLWGPYAEYQATELIGQAMSGILTLSGYPDRPPVMLPKNQAMVSAGIQAAQGILAALLQRERSGRGQVVEVSMQEALSMSQETAMQTWDMRRELRKRTGQQRLMPGFGPYECQDGHVMLMVGVGGAAGAPWSVLLDWMAREGKAGDLTEPEWSEVITNMNMRFLTALATDPETYKSFAVKLAHIDEVLTAFTKSKKMQDLYEEGQAQRLLVGPVNSPRDLLENRHLRARAWYAEVAHPELDTTVTYPGGPYRHSETPWAIRLRPPLLGEHTREVLQEAGYNEGDVEMLMRAGVV